MSEMVMLNTIMHFFHSPGDYVMPAKHSGSEEPRNALARTAAWKPNTAYYVSVSTWGGKTSAGNYYFLDLHSGDGIKKLSHWFEREDFGAVNKAFHFVTGRESEQYLEFGCYRSGSFQIDQLILVEDTAGTAVSAATIPEEQRNQIRRPAFTGFPVQADFEGSSFHSSILSPGTGYQGRFTQTPGEVISGENSAYGKAWARVNFLSTEPKQVPFSIGKTYRVVFSYWLLESASGEGQGFRFRILDGGGLQPRQIEGFSGGDAGDAVFPAVVGNGGKGHISAAGVSQFTVDLVGNDHNVMLPAKRTHPGKGLPIPDLPCGIVGITKDKKGRLGVGNGTLKGGKIDGMALPVIGKGARQNLPAVIRDRMEEDIVNGVRISPFSAGVVSFRTMLEMAGTTPVQKMSQSFSMEKPWRVFHQF